MTVELRVAVRAGKDVRDVVIAAPGGATAGEAADALAQHLGLENAPAGGWLLGTDEGTVGRDVPLTGGVRSGATLTVEREPREAAVARHRFELVVTSGPLAGTSFALAPGRHTLGRSRRAGFTLADAEVSREHVALTVADDTVTIEDLGSANGTFLNGAEVTEPTEVRERDTIELGRSLLEVRTATRRGPRSTGPVIQFNRPPRMPLPAVQFEHRVPAPPDPPRARRFPLVGALIPIVGGAAMAAFDRRMLLMAAASPIWVLGSYIEDRRGGRRDYLDQKAAFEAKVDAIAAAVATSRRAEEERVRITAPDVAEVARRVDTVDARIWERRIGDDDFLAFRVGFATRRSAVRAVVEEGGDPRLREAAEKRFEREDAPRPLPVLLELELTPIIGLAGAPDAVQGITRWLAVQAAAFHSPKDLVVAAIRPPGDEWSWLAWLPHVSGDESPIEGAHIASDTESATTLIDGIKAVIEARSSDGAASRFSAAPDPQRILLFVWDDAGVPRHLLAPILERGPAVGVRVVWVGSANVTSLPGECGATVVWPGLASGAEVVWTMAGASVPDVSADALTRERATNLAQSLSPIRDVSLAGGRGAVPRSAALTEVLGIEPAADDVLRRWSDAAGLDAPIGVSANGPFRVDLRNDGPHALVGGTTGAGKSELLQTWVAALAACHPPSRLTFLLVDYKGGAAFKDCVALPHTVGFVTDLDGHLVNRALVSLNAELRRREHILRDAGAKDLVELERVDPAAAPAAMVLIVDEFATLAKELPDFVDGVVNVAQRGRSLGIHMVLATQRPAGAINDNIRANTNLRIALRMNDAEDSDDVIGSKVAASLSRSLPGRAYARTGASELTEVQIAYAGGRSAGAQASTGVVVMDVRDGQVQRPKIQAASDDTPTDLQRYVSAIIDAAAQRGDPAPPPPWLPPIPEVVPLDQVIASADGERDRIPFGLIDRPDMQSQFVYGIDLTTEGSLLVYGGGGSGKTTLLRTMAAAVASLHTPEDTYVYGIDFAARALDALTALPHCGAVVGSGDPARVERLFRFLRREIGRRTDLLAASGVTDIAEYRRSTGPLSRILVLLDGYSGFHAAFENVEYGALLEQLPRFITDGRAVGVHFVITADRRNAVPSALSGVVGSVVVLRQSDPDDYGMLGLDLRTARAARLGPGRGFVRGTVELQVAVAGEDPSGEAQGAALAELGRRSRSEHGHGSAPSVDVLPTVAVRSEVAGGAGGVVFALGDDDLGPRAANPGDGNFLIVGPTGSGRSSALTAIATGMRAAHPDVRLVLAVPRRSGLAALPVWDQVATGVDEVDEAIDDLVRAVEQATDLQAAVFVDDTEELLDSAAEDRLASLLRAARGGGAWVVAAGEARAAHRAYGDFLVQLRRDRHGLLLQPDLTTDGDLLGAQLPRRMSGGFPPGRGFLVTRRGNEVVQVLLD